ncbi:Protein of unknown function [Gryllus bimaculatus]|nr:Protein of unknown function [Gryllus bimaculatus]
MGVCMRGMFSRLMCCTPLLGAARAVHCSRKCSACFLSRVVAVIFPRWMARSGAELHIYLRGFPQPGSSHQRGAAPDETNSKLPTCEVVLCKPQGCLIRNRLNRRICKHGPRIEKPSLISAVASCHARRSLVESPGGTPGPPEPLPIALP